MLGQLVYVEKESGEEMNPLVYVSITLHFEVTDSEMFGGKGSVGYTSTRFGGIENLEEIDESFIDSQIQIVARTLKVPSKNVKLISKEQYDHETEEDVEDVEDVFEGDEW